MKIFIYLIALTSILQFLSAHLYTNFRGSSNSFYDYLGWIAGLGGFLTYGLFIWACFITTWWIPIAAFAIAWVVKILIPPIPKLELLASALFPIAAVLSIILLILGK